MKKLISIILFSVLMLGALIGCAQKNGETTGNSAAEETRVSVVTTIFAPYDFARVITGGNADLTMLLPPASESHSYEPSPQDIIKIQNSDIFIYVGGETDSWVEAILKSMDTDKMKIISLLECVEVVEEEIVEGMQVGHGEDDSEHDDEDDDDHGEEKEFDEHVWTSPKNAKLIVKKIYDTLCEVDAENRDAYSKNTESYLTELDKLDDEFQSVVDSASRRLIVFGDRFPFRYFADAYDLEYFAAFPGCSTETEASAATVAFLIDKINAEDIPVVFHAELSNQKMADIISEGTGAKILQLHACHNVSKAEFESGIGYLELMRQNVQNLKEAIQ